MPDEGFLRRWARVKASAPAAAPAAPLPVAPPPATPLADPPATDAPAADSLALRNAPTLDEAAQLTPASDFSAFVSQGVDKDVRRLALKKLFADPHFNVMDRLDMYMDDYNKPSPVSAAMLGALQHARGALRRPEEVQAELARLAALEPPPHPGGVAQPMPATAPAPAGTVPADEAVPAPEATPGADPSGNDLPGEGLGDAADAAGAVQEPVADGAPAALASHAEAGDPLALPVVHAHNAEARP